MELKTYIKWLMPYGYVKKREESFGFTNETAIEPCIYNVSGEKKRTFYLQDNVCRHSPYSFSSIDIGKTNTINWDRSNKALPIHFYSHGELFGKQYDCRKRFGIILESETIVPELYEKCLRKPDIMKCYDAVFTSSQRLLEKYDNVFFIPASSVWYGGTAGGGILEENTYLKKKKMVSLVSSDKAMCELHRFRMQLAEWFYKDKAVDVMGTFRGGEHISISDSLTDYRYSIVVENNITSCYFTEKILNCFASMTVPIYVGAKKIGKFFNAKGIVHISPEMDRGGIVKIVKNCTEEDYNNKLDAIRDNFQRVHDYFCIEDYIYSKYKQMFEL